MLVLLVIIIIAFFLVALYVSQRPSFDVQTACALNRQWRLLWQQHVEWTRMLIISILERLPDEAAATARLLKNVPDMALIIGRYFGQDAANEFSTLFNAHLTIAADIAKTTRDGESTNALNTKWHKNAIDISAFLSKINPNHWDRNKIRQMMLTHLRLTASELAARAHRQYDQDIEAYNSIEKEALAMADLFSDGIVAKFSRLH